MSKRTRGVVKPAKTTKLPKEIKTMGQTWKVLSIEEFLGEPSMFGQCLEKERQIHVQAGMAPDAELDTLLHEIVHAYQEVNRVILPQDPDDRNEALSVWVSVMMVDLFKNNPELLKLFARKS